MLRAYPDSKALKQFKAFATPTKEKVYQTFERCNVFRLTTFKATG
jgi:hypothetical protein